MLPIAVDDATGHIVGVYFDEQETLNGYYHLLHQILSDYGIPYQFFTDNRTVFEYKKKHETAIEKDTFTQFGYACKQLGIAIRTSSVAQAKGRVERMFGTLQSRLPVELRLANVTSIQQANNDKINLTLAVLSSRKIDNGSCLKYQNEYYLPVNSQGIAVHHRKGTTAMVIKAFNGELYSCIGEQVYALELLPEHKPSSKAFDLATIPEVPKKKYIPPMNHPWKQASFEKYAKSQSHRKIVA